MSVCNGTTTTRANELLHATTHGCEREDGHKGKHRCCCGYEWKDPTDAN